MADNTNRLDLIVELIAVERMCLFYGDKIEEYRELDPPVPETLAWLEERNVHFGGRMAELLNSLSIDSPRVSHKPFGAVEERPVEKNSK